MQLKQIPRDALLKPLQAVSGIVERRHTLPILANVLVEQKDGRLFMTATDLEMQITAHSALEGKQDQSVTVAARKLQALLRALPEDATVSVDTSASKMTVRMRIASARGLPERDVWNLQHVGCRCANCPDHLWSTGHTAGAHSSRDVRFSGMSQSVP